MINFPYRFKARTGPKPLGGQLSRREIKELSEVGALPDFQANIAGELAAVITEQAQWLNNRVPDASTRQQRQRRIRALRLRRAHYESKRGINDGPLLIKYGVFFAVTLIFATAFMSLRMQQVTGNMLFSPDLQQLLIHTSMALFAGSSLMLGWVGLAQWLVPGYYPVDPRMATPSVRIRFVNRRMVAIRKIDLICDAIEHLQAVESTR